MSERSPAVEVAVEVTAERFATGGESIARLDDGRVLFVRGALPGERVLVHVEREKKKFAHGVVSEILEASPNRVVAPCDHAASDECGGCDFMHIDRALQKQSRIAIVTEQLQRLGGVGEPMVAASQHDSGPRTTVRCQVTNGRAGYRRRRSHDSFVARTCVAADPHLEELIVDGRFGDATEVTLRVSITTDQRMAVVDEATTLSTVQVPSGVVVTHAGNEAGNAFLTEIVGTRSWRYSSSSFFQTSYAGAVALVAEVSSALPARGSVIDLYAGVGMLGGAAAPDQLVAAVEANASSAADARHNLPPHIDVVPTTVERWTPTSAVAVIADPSRRGLQATGVAAIHATEASALVLVSCDPASLGRDAALLAADGWRHQQSVVVDMFPDTSQVEAVSRFSR